MKRKWIFFLIVFILTVHYSFSQNTVFRSNTELEYKNAIKGMVVPLIWYNSFSIGYERHIDKHSLVELVINNQYRFDEMGVPNYVLCIMPGYKYSIISNAKWCNNIWIGGYLVYRAQTDFHKDNGVEINHTSYHYGIGISFGKKIYLSRDRSWFLDIGFGASNNMFGSVPLFSSTDWAEDYYADMLARPVLQFGKKF
jgi:hypothetical protein